MVSGRHRYFDLGDQSNLTQLNEMQELITSRPYSAKALRNSDRSPTISGELYSYLKDLNILKTYRGCRSGKLVKEKLKVKKMNKFNIQTGELQRSELKSYASKNIRKRSPLTFINNEIANTNFTTIVHCEVPSSNVRENAVQQLRGRHRHEQKGLNVKQTSHQDTTQQCDTTAKRENRPCRKTPNVSMMTNKHQMILGCCNVTTCKDDAKLGQCAIAAKQLGQQLCFITETHRIGNGLIDQWPKHAELSGWQFVYSGLRRKAAAGVGIFCNEEAELVDFNVVTEGRILHARIKIKGIKLNVWCIYAPTNATADATKTVFFATLAKSVREMHKKYPSWKVMIAGDWNSTLGPDAPISPYIGNNYIGEYPTTDNGYKMAEFLSDHKLYALNTLFETKPNHRVTWQLGRTKKRLDYFVADYFIRRCTQHCRAYPAQSALFESNHRLLVCHLQMPSRAQRTVMFERRKPKPKPILRSLRDESPVRRQYAEALDQELPRLESQVELTAEELNNRIIEGIQAATATAVPVAACEEDPWITPEFRELVHELLGEKVTHKRRKLAKKLKKTRARLKTTFHKERAFAINAAAENRQVEEEYRLLKDKKMLRNSSKVLCPADKLHVYFKNHFAARPRPSAPELDNLQDHQYLLPDSTCTEIDVSIPSSEEVRRACEQLKNNRCLGSDRVAGEQLKYADCPKLQQYVHALIVRVWVREDCPQGWRLSRLKPLWKCKGSVTEAAMYRGLMINATLNKVLIMIVITRVREHYEHSILPFQWGFRRARSTTDGVFVARQITTKVASQIFGSFIDLRAAYDHLYRPLIWRILRMRLGEKADKIIRILECTYEDTQAKLDGVDAPIPIKVGVRQGGVESCVIFNYVLDTVMRVVLAKIEAIYPGAGIIHRYDIHNECTDRQQRMAAAARGVSTSTVIMYADDILLLGRSKQELEGMMAIVLNTFTDYGLTLATDKTFTMTWNTAETVREQKSLIQVGGEDLGNVRQFRYLGHVLTDDPKRPQYITNQIGFAWSKWAEIKGVLCDREISLWIRVRMLETMIRSRLVYAVQSDRLKAAERNKLDSIWVNFCRKLLKGGYRRKKDTADGEDGDYAYCLSNAEVLRICKTSPISEFCQRQHIKYIAHIARMPNDSELKQWLFTKSEHKYARCQWKELGRDLGLDEMQVRRMLFKREELQRWLQCHESRWAE